jgi:tRNA A-37 threonylcarbamoyl transferase component Bud32
VPKSGEFVRWLKETDMKFAALGLRGTREFGLISEYEKLGKNKTRPFNRMTTDGDTVIKEAIDEQGRKLARRETAWYEHAARNGVSAIPAIYSTEPLKMERIRGKNIYELNALTLDEKTEILRKIIDALRIVHASGGVPADAFGIWEAYYGKTMKRLCRVRDLIPFADRRTITVNGRECRNVFFHKRDFGKLIESLKCEHFVFIHGDCTFSNIMLRENKEEPVFIDPRGYFGHSELYGDPNYDWAKLYYSVVGNYDRFNLKDFRLTIGESSVDLDIESNGWEDAEEAFFRLTGADERTVKLLHSVIWLSLTTYAWQDYDSVCGAFYNGLWHFEELMWRQSRPQICESE